MGTCTTQSYHILEKEFALRKSRFHLRKISGGISLPEATSTGESSAHKIQEAPDDCRDVDIILESPRKRLTLKRGKVKTERVKTEEMAANVPEHGLVSSPSLAKPWKSPPSRDEWSRSGGLSVQRSVVSCGLAGFPYLPVPSSAAPLTYRV